MIQGSVPCRPRDFCLCQMSRPALFSTEPLTKLMQGVLYQGVNHSRHATDHSPSLMSRLAMSGAVPLLPLCVHMVCTETTLPLPSLCCVSLLLELWIYVMWNEIGNQPQVVCSWEFQSQS
jgi:hypothetical protein